MASSSDWDPCTSRDTVLSKKSTERILQELKELTRPLSHMHVYCDEEDITKVHVLILGELYTPYEGGFFYFLIRFPQNYPKMPPKVKLMNTGGGRVRFNPNVYATGMVCHGMLGTWGEKSWKPEEHRLVHLLDVIQSMLQEKPFEKEPVPFLPGAKFPELPGNDMSKYDDVIRHETLRVAVCDMMEGQVDMPNEMRAEIKTCFNKFYRRYKKICKDNSHLNDIDLNKHDPFSELTLSFEGLHLGSFNLNAQQQREGKFDFSKILERLEKIKEDLDKEEEL